METLARHFDTALDTPDGIKKLRELILSLAMKGKLVAQDAKDQPASELLKEIEKEKAKLVKDGRLKSAALSVDRQAIKPEDIPYELPKGWEWVRLGNILQFINGDRGKNYPSKDKLSKTGIPFISAINLDKGTVSTNNLLCVNEEQFKKLGSGKLEKNDIVFCIRGSLGKSAIYPFEKGAIASSLVILRQLYKNEAMLSFLNLYISSPLVFKEIKKYDNGTAQPNLSANNFMSFLFPLPPLAEQKRIVEKIDQLMSLCDKLEAERNERDNKRITVHTSAVNRLLGASDKPAFDKSWSFITKNFNELYSVTPNIAELKKAILQLAVMGKLVAPACRQAGRISDTLPEKQDGKWWVYVIECNDGTFYKGFTGNLRKRWEEHCAGTASDWTKKHPPKQVYYWEECYSQEAAIEREKYLKSGIGREWFKREVVDKPGDWLPASELLKEIEAEKARLVKEGKIKKQVELPPIKPEEIPYQVPEGWVWCRLDDLCSLITDGTHNTPVYITEGIPFLSVKNLSGGFIDYSDTKHISINEHKELIKRCNPEYDDVLLTKVGTTGIAVRVDTKETFSIFVSVALLKTIKGYIDSEFLTRLINSPLVKKYSAEGTEGVGNKNLVLKKIKNFVIPLPPLAEQKRIVAKIDQLMELCNSLEQGIKVAMEKRSRVLGAVLARV